MHLNHQDYVQPDFYRFSEDSLHLIRTLEELNLIHTEKIMDLCAGCGVVGLEYALRSKAITQLDFCEIQNEFISFLEKNKKIFLNERVNSRVFHESYKDLLKRVELNGLYDCVIANPPYFHLGHGIESPNVLKNKCRFFMDASLEELLQVYSYLLKVDSAGFMVIRNDQKFMNDEIQRLKKTFSNTLRISELRIFPSCHVFEIKKI
jgi:tRNA1Val (adenine37-N6)-methyltransferase